MKTLIPTVKFRWQKRKVHYPSNFEGGPGLSQDRWFLQQGLLAVTTDELNEKTAKIEWRDIEGTPEGGFKL